MLAAWLVLSVSVWLTAKILPGFRVQGLGNAIVVAAIFGLLNYFLGWFLRGVIGIATFGLGFLFLFLTRWVVNALLLKLTDALSSKLAIRDFGTALVAAILMSGIGTAGEYLLRHFPS